MPVGLVSSCMGATSLSTWLPGFAWYNGMISPINKMTVRGVLWYQGEGDPTEYGERLARLIRRWREDVYKRQAPPLVPILALIPPPIPAIPRTPLAERQNQPFSRWITWTI